MSRRASVMSKGVDMHDVECPTCGHNARQYARLHCTSPACPWLVCTNKECGTVYSWEAPETYHY